MSFRQLRDEWVGNSPSTTAPVELCWYIMGYVGFQPRIIRTFDATPEHKYIIDSDHVLLLLRCMHVDEMYREGYEFNVVLINVRTGKEFTTTMKSDGWKVPDSTIDLFTSRFMESVGEKPGTSDCAERNKRIEVNETPIQYMWSYDIILYSDHVSKFYIGLLDDYAPMLHNEVESIIPAQPYCASCVCSKHVVFTGTEYPNHEFIGTFTNVDTKEQWPLHVTASTVVGAIDGTIVFMINGKLCYYDLDSRRVCTTPFSAGDYMNTWCGSMCNSRRDNLTTHMWAGIYDGILRILTVVNRC